MDPNIATLSDTVSLKYGIRPAACMLCIKQTSCVRGRNLHDFIGRSLIGCVVRRHVQLVFTANFSRSPKICFVLLPSQAIVVESLRNRTSDLFCHEHVYFWTEKWLDSLGASIWLNTRGHEPS